MINGPFYTYRRMHFTSGHASFCDICLSCHMAHITFGQSTSILERDRKCIRPYR